MRNLKIDSSTELYGIIEDYLTTRSDSGIATPEYDSVDGVYQSVIENLPEIVILSKFKSMCEESLPPEYFEMFEKVKAKLFKNRKDLHFSDCALHNEPESPNGECDCKTDEKVVTEGVRDNQAFRELIVFLESKQEEVQLKSSKTSDFYLEKYFKGRISGIQIALDFAQSQH